MIYNKTQIEKKKNSREPIRELTVLVKLLEYCSNYIKPLEFQAVPIKMVWFLSRWFDYKQICLNFKPLEIQLLYHKPSHTILVLFGVFGKPALNPR